MSEDSKFTTIDGNPCVRFRVRPTTEENTEIASTQNHTRSKTNKLNLSDRAKKRIDDGRKKSKELKRTALPKKGAK